MILAEFRKFENNYVGFTISGHADYDDYGKDIVCASVSSAAQLMSNTITDFMGIDAAVNAVNNTVSLDVSDKCNNPVASKLIESLKVHLTMLSDDFIGTINIRITEV